MTRMIDADKLLIFLEEEFVVPNNPECTNGWNARSLSVIEEVNRLLNENKSNDR